MIWSVRAPITLYWVDYNRCHLIFKANHYGGIKVELHGSAMMILICRHILQYKARLWQLLIALLIIIAQMIFIWNNVQAKFYFHFNFIMHYVVSCYISIYLIFNDFLESKYRNFIFNYSKSPMCTFKINYIQNMIYFEGAHLRFWDLI